MIYAQLGPAKGTSAWVRGSIDAMIIMTAYGLEPPLDWAMPDGLRYLPATAEWPARAVWTTHGTTQK